MTANALLRQLPSVEILLAHPSSTGIIAACSRTLVADALRETLEVHRVRLLAEGGELPDTESLITEASYRLAGWIAPGLHPVINATGVILHTNLGRAPLSDHSLAAMQAVAAGYSTLEYDLESGQRGSRSQHIEALITRLTGAEAALVVNNNAAAVLLTLSALGAQREAMISRGQLVEIGGGFRIPDVMAQSGAVLVEVGTTNRTRLSDYERAINEKSAVVLRAHRSNFAMIGFTEEPALAELAEVAHKHHLWLLDDLGSGALLDTSPFGLAPEPTVQASLAAGADVVMFSGDKLLGGPQAGLIIGRKTAIDQLRQHPLARAVRADKLCLSALSATLIHYLKQEALACIPIWQMISASVDNLEQRARSWQSRLIAAGFDCDVIDTFSAVGGGSLPGESLPTRALAIRFAHADEAARQLRTSSPHVIVRIEDDQVILDPRTVLPREEDALLSALLQINRE
jgi:L-seryl-tRNA(Ser) seleniumtransferase